MNKSKEKYKEALEKLPEIEKQIEKINKFKGELISGNLNGFSLVMMANKKDGGEEESYLDKEKKDYQTLSSFFFTPQESTHKDNRIATNEVEVSEKIALGVCDMMMQILIEQRNILIARIKQAV